MVDGSGDLPALQRGAKGRILPIAQQKNIDERFPLAHVSTGTVDGLIRGEPTRLDTRSTG